MASEVALCIGGQKAAAARVEAACEVFSAEWDLFVGQAEAASEGLSNSGMPAFIEALGAWSLALGGLSSELMAYGLALRAVDERAEKTELTVSREFHDFTHKLEAK